MQKQKTATAAPKHSRRHVIKSSIWVFGGQIGGQVLRLASNLVMTRLLVPEMFGVMTVANTVIVGLALCSYFGLHHNIIQSPRGDEKIFLDSAWTMQILRGMLLWIIALLIAIGLYYANQAGMIPESSAYADPDLPAILAVLSFTALISGFESTKLATASRHMAVGRLTMIDLMCQLAGLLTMIAFALIHKSIWALVFGTLVGAILKVIVSYTMLPGEGNQLAWEKRSISDLFGFGKWILLTTIMGFFVKNSDKLILGALITPQMLGIYSIAIFMTAALQDILTKWAAAVVLPVLSRTHRENSHELSNVYYRFSQPFNIATLFLCGFLYNAGFIIIDLLYDSRYQSAGQMIQILSISLLGSRTILAEQVYLALGKPKLTVPMNIIQLVVLFTLLVPSYHYYGMQGALHVIALTILLTLPLTWYFLRKFGLLNWKRELITLPVLLAGYVSSILFVYAYKIIKAAIVQS